MSVTLYIMLHYSKVKKIEHCCSLLVSSPFSSNITFDRSVSMVQVVSVPVMNCKCIWLQEPAPLHQLLVAVLQLL